MTRALILGIGGQDGSYLADILLKRGYEVHGLYRRSSVNNLLRIEHIRDKIVLHQGDITDGSSINRILRSVSPQELYNVADQDHVGWSLNCPEQSLDVTARSVVTILEAVRIYNKQIRVFQPCSAVMFGDAPPPQNEGTSHNPQSPYGCAKTAAYHLARYYRQAYEMFVSTAILYNHDSPRRTGEYLLHQICRQARSVVEERANEITVGTLLMLVDIGYARDYMETVVDTLQQEEPDDFILASDNPVSIQKIVEMTTEILACQNCQVRVDSSLLRPGKQPRLIGDVTKAKSVLGFSPKCSIRDLLKMILNGGEG